MPVLEDRLPKTATRENQLLALIPRFRWLFVGMICLLMALAFNGRWRIGRDSAAYRGLAHQLATTGKYEFRNKVGALVYTDQQDTRYPGLPLILAGVEKAAGRSDAATVSVMVAIAILTLVLTYVLIKPTAPAWLAIAVVFGMGVNGRFLEHANEILTDVPFLLGVVVSLLGFDRLERARGTGARGSALLLLVAGLLFSAAMRPTFWVLALALFVTCAWGIFKPTHAGQTPADAKPRRLACLLTLGVLIVASVTFLLVVDMRGKAAGYEQKLLWRFEDFYARVLAPLPENVYSLLEETLPESFFGTELGPRFIPVWPGHGIGFSTLFSLLVIASGVALVRRNLLWGLFVLFTILTMAVIGSVPRYFIMVLPLLLVAWGHHVARVADRFKAWGFKEAAAFVGLGMVVIPNLIGSANLIREQHGLGGPKQGFKRVGFLQAYHSGTWVGVEDVARMIRENVRPDQTIFGPEATVLTYLSGRDVHGLGRLLPRKNRGGVWDRKLRLLKQQFAYGVFPDQSDKLYKDKDVVTGVLIRDGRLVATRTIATTGGYKLCEYEVVAPPPKRKATRRSTKDPIAATQPKPPRRRRAATTQSTTRPTTQSTTQSTTAPTTRSSAAARRRRAAAAAAAATRATTVPSTSPATTRPTTRPAR